MKENSNSSPMNLQFFAETEGATETTTETAKETTAETTTEVELSAEEKLQQTMVELAKLKKSFDKASSEAATYKKQLREKLSADEIALQENAEKEHEKEEKLNQLLKENTIAKLEKGFLTLGYSGELATKAATAQFENDADELFKIQKEYQDSFAKKIEAEWLKNRPEANMGTGESGSTVTKEEFDRYGYLQKVEFKQKNPLTYKKYTKQTQ